MMNDPLGPLVDSPLAVVPIFVNAGAALVPALIASVTSVLAILLKPRELLAVLRRKPWIVAVIVLAAGGVWVLVASLTATPARAAATAREAAQPEFAKPNYWTDVALAAIAKERDAAKTTGLRPLWAYDPDQGMVLSTPALAGDKVIGTAAVQDVGTFFGQIYALDAATGAKQWGADKAEGEDLKPFFSSPAVTADQKYVVVGQGLHVDADCSLLCFDAATGALRWRVKTPLHIESSPAVRGDLAVVGAGAIEDDNHKPKGDPGFVLAVQISTGKELWRHPVNDPESSPAIADDGTVYIGAGFNGNAVVALRSQTDDELKILNLPRELWKTPAPYPITGPVTLVNDLVIVGGGNGDFVYEDPKPAGVVIALDRKTGQVKWQRAMDAAVLGGIAHADGKLYCPVRTGHVVALDLATGNPLWKQSVSGQSPVLGGIAVHEGTVFAVSKDGYLALLAAADGKVIEKHALNSPTRPPDKGFTLSTPVIAGGRLYVGSETGGLRCFEFIKPTP